MNGAVRVPFLALSEQQTELRDQLTQAVTRVLGAERVLLGPELEAFEAAWATAVGADHAVGVGSGLDALVLALRAVGVGAGHEVVVPSHTFVATWLAVLHAGGTPVPVDVDPETGAWPAAAVEEAVTDRTAAIMPVHLYGHPVDLDPLLAVAAARGIPVVDDAAQAHGATYRSRPVGALTTATAWSFYPGKNLGALGDGGAVTTDDPEVARRVQSLRNYGSTVKYVHEDVGWNSRLDEVQAAILSVKLRRLAAWNDRRRLIAARYAAELAGLDLVLPSTAPDVQPVWHLYVVRSPGRDRLRAALAEQGIETLVHYPVAPHRQPAFTDTPLAQLHLPGADRMAAEVLSLPMGPHLTDAQQTSVVAAVRAHLA